MPHTFVILTTDSLSRPNKDLMSPQMLMELLVQDLHMRSLYFDIDGGFKDIHEWDDVSMDSDGNVTVIDWDCLDNLTGGTIDLRWIPPMTQDFYIASRRIEGQIDTSILPPCLGRIDVSNNRFFGEFHTKTLSGSLTVVFIQRNSLSGPLDLTCLPLTLRYFWANENGFSGHLDLTHLPNVIESLHLNNNCFVGDVSYLRLPESLSALRLHENPIKQHEVVVPKGSASLQEFTVGISMFEKITDEYGNHYEVLKGTTSARVYLQRYQGCSE